MNKDHKVIFSALLSLFIIGVIIFVVISIFRTPLLYTGKASDLPVGLRLVPDTSVLSQDPGVNVSVNLIPEDHAISAIDLVLEYNPKLLSITENDVTVGLLLPLKLGTVQIETINDELNNIRVILLAKCSSSSCTPAVTSGKLVNFLFKATSANSMAQVAFSTKTKVYLASDISVNNSGYQYTTNKINLIANSTNASSLVLKPIADTYVKSGYPTKNYSSENNLVASNYESSNIQLAFIKYDLGEVAGKISKAKLRIVPSLSRSVSKPVKIVNSSTWEENSVTWNNKPAVSTEIGRYIGTAKIGEPVIIELNPIELNKYLTNKITLSVGGDSDFNNTLQFSSREVLGREPELLLEIESQPSVTSLYPKDDSYVQSQSDRADNSYGDQTTLVTSTFESTNTKIAYLKFDASQIQGKQIKSAELVITPSISREIQKVVRTVSDNNWNEEALTYKNRPAVGVIIGSINYTSDPVEVGKLIIVNLDPSKLIISASGEISIAIENSASQDTLSIYSKEYTNIDMRPKLNLEVY